MLFNLDGSLELGVHHLTFPELYNSILVQGPDLGYPNWDKRWRKHLVSNLQILADQLWEVGIENIYIGGSFTDDKDHPNDIDGYFECGIQRIASGELQRKLNKLDPYRIWTWDPGTRRPYRGYPKKQLPMWFRYRVELYPHYNQLSGIKDAYGNPLTFPSAFRLSRHNVPKGIVKIIK